MYEYAFATAVVGGAVLGMSPDGFTFVLLFADVIYLFVWRFVNLHRREWENDDSWQLEIQIYFFMLFFSMNFTQETLRPQI